MDAHIRKVYVPMTETGVLHFAVPAGGKPMGTASSSGVKDMTSGGDSPQPGHAVSAPCQRWKRAGSSALLREEEKTGSSTKITPLGQEVLGLEMKRIARLYRNMEGGAAAMKEKKGSRPSVYHWPIGKRNRTTCAASTSVDGSWTGSRFFNCYHFVRCQPEDVVYQLDYNPEGLANKEEYVQLFADCGWEYLQDYAGYSYFRKAAGPRWAAGTRRSSATTSHAWRWYGGWFWGRMVPALVILLLLVCPYVIQGLISPHEDTVVLLALFLCLLALYTVALVKFACQYWKLRQRR